LALFGTKKKAADEAPDTQSGGAANGNGKRPNAGGGDGGGAGGEDFVGDAGKAEAFYKHAATVHETGSYEYAMQLWLQGIERHPPSVKGLEGFLNSASHYYAENPKKGVPGDVKKATASKGRIGQYVQALLASGCRPMSGADAVRVAELAAQIAQATQQIDAARILGQRALVLLQRDAKQAKAPYVRLLDAAEAAGIFDVAEAAGSMASRLDPSDGELQARVRNMMAAKTMQASGFTGEAGGFRGSIRDTKRQEELEQEDRIAKTDETKDRLVEKTKQEYEASPASPPLIERYAKALLERGKPGDELKAILVYSKGYEATKQFLFRKKAGDVKIRMAERTVAALRDKAEARPDDEAARKAYEDQLANLRNLQAEEYRLQEENYPTDNEVKLRLGRLLHDLGRHEESIPYLQKAMQEAKYALSARMTLGQAFLAMGGWEEAAVESFRAALEQNGDTKDERSLAIKYGLMTALVALARAQRELGPAEEADRLAAAIAMQDFGYRDVQDQRRAIKELINELKG